MFQNIVIISNLIVLTFLILIWSNEGILNCLFKLLFLILLCVNIIYGYKVVRF